MTAGLDVRFTAGMYTTSVVLQPGSKTMTAILKHHPVNLRPVERVGRVLVGVAAAVGALVWVALIPSLMVAVGAVLLAIAGIDLVVTGTRGYCPLYAWLARRRAKRTAS